MQHNPGRCGQAQPSFTRLSSPIPQISRQILNYQPIGQIGDRKLLRESRFTITVLSNTLRDAHGQDSRVSNVQEVPLMYGVDFNHLAYPFDRTIDERNMRTTHSMLSGSYLLFEPLSTLEGPGAKSNAWGCIAPMVKMYRSRGDSRAIIRQYIVHTTALFFGCRWSPTARSWHKVMNARRIQSFCVYIAPPIYVTQKRL